METVLLVAFLLTVIGGLNWGLVGVMNTNLVNQIFGEDSPLSKLIYALVGISALLLALEYKRFM